MSDASPASRLDQLRFARRVVEKQATEQLAQIDRWIADEERRQVEQQRAADLRPPDPDWLIEMGLTGRAATYVHVGGCHMTSKRCKAITADQARTALHEQVPPCPQCRPDNELGVLE